MPKTKRLWLPQDFADDPVVTEFAIDHSGNRVATRSIHKWTKEILAANRAEEASWGKSNPYTGALQKGFTKVASIPNDILEDWAKEWGLGLGDKEFKLKMVTRLNDPEYLYLKTSTAKLGDGKGESLIFSQVRGPKEINE